MDALDRFRLNDRVAIVTGASGALGTQFALALAGAGADVVLTGRRQDALEAAAAQITATGRRALTVTADVRDSAECERIVAEAVEAFGRVDVLINNAGITYASPARRDSGERFAEVLQTNVTSAYDMARAAANQMIAEGHGGSVVNIASALGLSGSDLPAAAYSASKAGLLGLTRDLAMQWSARYGIRVNALAPGFFDSDMTAEISSKPKMLNDVLKRTPMNRLGEPGELDGALLLLASDAGSYITGVTLAVDGGWTLH